MRLIRLLLAAVVAAVTAAALAPAAHAELRRVEPVKKFRRQLVKVKRDSRVAVLLPARVTVDVPRGRRLEARATATRTSWNLVLGVGPRCGGANACFVGSFAAERGGVPAFRRKVRLRGGITGYFNPTSCGASCSPPQIQWVRRGVLYDIQFREAGRGSDRAKLVRLANSALAAGPR